MMMLGITFGLLFAQAVVTAPANTTPTPASSPTPSMSNVAVYCATLTSSPALADLENTCVFALGAKPNLPNFVCHETVQRFESVDKLAPHRRKKLIWLNVGLFTAEVRFTPEDGERYFNVLFNSKPLSATNEGSSAVEVAQAVGQRLRPTLTSDELASELHLVFSPALIFDPDAKATLTARKAEKKNSYLTFDFTIKRENSKFRWISEDAETHPGITGSLHLDPSSLELRWLRIEATEIDPRFTQDVFTVETIYDRVKIEGAGSFLLPVSSATMQCYTGRTLCFRNALTFSNCRKFGAESHMITDTVEPVH